MTTPSGSALLVLFSPDLRHVARGYSREDEVCKLFGGLNDEGDIVRTPEGGINELATSIACAYRELWEESGGLTRNDLYLLTEFCKPRRWLHNNNPDFPRFQYPFIGVLREGVRLPRVDDGELIDLKFIPLAQTLGNVYLPKESHNRLNPFHGIVVAKAIMFLRDKLRGDPRFNLFLDAVGGLATQGVYLDTYVDMVEEDLRRHAF